MKLFQKISSTGQQERKLGRTGGWALLFLFLIFLAILAARVAGLIAGPPPAWYHWAVVAAGLADRCQVQLAYAIGVAQPVSVLVDTFGTGTVGDDKLETAVRKVFDLRPTAIIRDLDLRKPIYRKLAAYGHMGREDLGVTWEKTDRTEALKAAAAEA